MSDASSRAAYFGEINPTSVQPTAAEPAYVVPEHTAIDMLIVMQLVAAVGGLVSVTTLAHFLQITRDLVLQRLQVLEMHSGVQLSRVDGVVIAAALSPGVDLLPFVDYAAGH